MASRGLVEPITSDLVSEGGGWPLSFTMKVPEPGLEEESRGRIESKAGLVELQPVPWPQRPKVTAPLREDQEESERIAYFHFLEDSLGVVGFDLEWLCSILETTRARLQDRVGPITVALFHIGELNRTTAVDLLAPSLWRLIESPDILKSGVGILSSDFRQLQKFSGFSRRVLSS